MSTILNVSARGKIEANVATASKDIVREAVGTEGTVSLSSERFNFVGLEESGVPLIRQANCSLALQRSHPHWKMP